MAEITERDVIDLPADRPANTAAAWSGARPRLGCGRASHTGTHPAGWSKNLVGGRSSAAPAHLDAIFAASDMMAAGVLAALERAGRRVPEDIAVAGYDDAPIATRTRPQHSWHRYAAQLTGQLLRRINGDDPSGVVMPVELVVRGSA